MSMNNKIFERKKTFCAIWYILNIMTQSFNFKFRKYKTRKYWCLWREWCTLQRMLMEHKQEGVSDTLQSNHMLLKSAQHTLYPQLAPLVGSKREKSMKRKTKTKQETGRLIRCFLTLVLHDVSAWSYILLRFCWNIIRLSNMMTTAR